MGGMVDIQWQTNGALGKGQRKKMWVEGGCRKVSMLAVFIKVYNVQKHVWNFVLWEGVYFPCGKRDVMIYWALILP